MTTTFSEDETDTPLTLSAYIRKEDSLIKKAKKALPRKFDVCTENQGYVKQEIFSCLSCDVPGGICYSCSISCHGNHNIQSLGIKTHFKCDCGNPLFENCPVNRCTLTKKYTLNPENVYNQNYHGYAFCYCKEQGETDCDIMIQCVSCEDWFHNTCLEMTEGELQDKALICKDWYVHLSCNQLHSIEKFDWFKRYATHPQVKMVPWKQVSVEILKDLSKSPNQSITETFQPSPLTDSSTLQVGQKREREVTPRQSRETTPSSPKRTRRVSPSPFKASNSPKSCVYKTLSSPPSIKFQLVLLENPKSVFCQCNDCKEFYTNPSSLETHPGIANIGNDIPLFQTPVDDEPEKPLDVLALEQLQSMPRDKAIETVERYNEMKKAMSEFLTSHQGSGVITADQVRNFFAERIQRKSQ